MLQLLELRPEVLRTALRRYFFSGKQSLILFLQPGHLGNQIVLVLEKHNFFLQLFYHFSDGLLLGDTPLRKALSQQNVESHAPHGVCSQGVILEDFLHSLQSVVLQIHAYFEESIEYHLPRLLKYSRIETDQIL